MGFDAGWRTRLAEKWDALSAVVRIAMVGKYTGLSDAYLSVLKALQHACLSASRKLEVLWVEASHLEPTSEVPSLVPASPVWHITSAELPTFACSCVHWKRANLQSCIALASASAAALAERFWQAALPDTVHLKCVCSHVQRHIRTRLCIA